MTLGGWNIMREEEEERKGVVNKLDCTAVAFLFDSLNSLEIYRLRLYSWTTGQLKVKGAVNVDMVAHGPHNHISDLRAIVFSSEKQ